MCFNAPSSVLLPTFLFVLRQCFPWEKGSTTSLTWVSAKLHCSDHGVREDMLRSDVTLLFLLVPQALEEEEVLPVCSSHPE